jgi:hypothetical protein
MKIYLAKYCPCIHESSYLTISTHRSLEGADEAVEAHKAEVYKEWEEYNNSCIESDPEFYSKYPNKFGEHEDWYISESELLD